MLTTDDTVGNENKINYEVKFIDRQGSYANDGCCSTSSAVKSGPGPEKEGLKIKDVQQTIIFPCVNRDTLSLSLYTLGPLNGR